MKTIRKYPLELAASQVVTMREGATILSVQAQGGDICLWAAVDDEAPVEGRRILICATGRPIDHLRAGDRFIGTVQERGFVWHVFEEVAP